LAKYDDIDLKEIAYLIEVEGYSENQLIEYLQISRSTFYKWKKDKDKSDFSNTLKKSKKKLVAIVKNSLIERTQGKYVFEYKEVIVNGKIEKLETKKYIQASDTAIIFTLANFDPKNFRRQDKQVEEKKDKVDIGNVHADDISELEKRIMNEDF